MDLQYCRSRIFTEAGRRDSRAERERDREEVKSLGKSWDCFCESAVLQKGVYCRSGEGRV